MTVTITEQHLRESVAIAALAEAGMTHHITRLHEYQGFTNPMVDCQDVAWRIFTMEAMAKPDRLNVACWECYCATPWEYGYQAAAEACTHEVRF